MLYVRLMAYKYMHMITMYIMYTQSWHALQSTLKATMNFNAERLEKWKQKKLYLCIVFFVVILLSHRA